MGKWNTIKKFLLLIANSVISIVSVNRLCRFRTNGKINLISVILIDYVLKAFRNKDELLKNIIIMNLKTFYLWIYHRERSRNFIGIVATDIHSSFQF